MLGGYGYELTPQPQGCTLPVQGGGQQYLFSCGQGLMSDAAEVNPSSPRAGEFYSRCQNGVTHLLEVINSIFCKVVKFHTSNSPPNGGLPEL